MNLKKESQKSHLIDIIIAKLLLMNKMDFQNRINRISSILELLSKGYELSTPSLVERFGVSKKIFKLILKSIFYLCL